MYLFFFFKQKTAYEMRISDWSSDVCSSDLPVSPLVCYEAIFPGAATGEGGRPGWLLNLTNDAWYGRPSGQYQHQAITRMRAVGEGMTLERAAHNGISFVAATSGRTLAELGIGCTREPQARQHTG